MCVCVFFISGVVTPVLGACSGRCGLGERSGMLLLHMLDEKPGLEVDASEGNPFGEEVEKKVIGSLVHWFNGMI